MTPRAHLFGLPAASHEGVDGVHDGDGPALLARPHTAVSDPLHASTALHHRLPQSHTDRHARPIVFGVAVPLAERGFDHLTGIERLAARRTVPWVSRMEGHARELMTYIPRPLDRPKIDGVTCRSLPIEGSSSWPVFIPNSFTSAPSYGVAT